MPPATIPFPFNPVALSASPSRSLSFASTPFAAETDSVVPITSKPASVVATGARFTVTCDVADSVCVPSFTDHVTVRTGCAPLDPSVPVSWYVTCESSPWYVAIDAVPLSVSVDVVAFHDTESPLTVPLCTPATKSLSPETAPPLPFAIRIVALVSVGLSASVITGAPDRRLTADPPCTATVPDAFAAIPVGA